ncbi:hypothetical protein N752_20460 [Desulforamulus aquiferis]|nr:hypothetical protein N752_20460 [Desulforamulus aquiferis]
MSMQEFYVVDGYNIIHAWPDFEGIIEGGLDHGRDKLIDIIANFASLTGSVVKIVFDAHLVKKGIEHSEMIHGIEVFYTQEGETADSLIERIVGDLTKLGTVYVATSDWMSRELFLAGVLIASRPRSFAPRYLKSINKASSNLPKRTPQRDTWRINCRQILG